MGICCISNGTLHCLRSSCRFVLDYFSLMFFRISTVRPLLNTTKLKIVGMGLAAYKVTVSLNALARWGLQNFSTAFALLLYAYGIAGTIGPFLGWIALSHQGDIPLKTAKADEVLDDVNHKQTTEQTMSIFLFVMGGISMLGFILNAFLCKKVVLNNENL